MTHPQPTGPGNPGPGRVPTLVELKAGTVPCDGAAIERATVVVAKPDGTDAPPILAFCAHHADRHAIMLDATGWKVTHDVRDRKRR